MEYRNECVDVLTNNFGIVCDAHHHEVATAGQCEIDIRFDSLVNTGDAVQSYKYIVKNIAKKHNMIATMMPKPIALDNGSGMHVNVSLWNKSGNLFYDSAEASWSTRTHLPQSWRRLLTRTEGLCPATKRRST
jgi:glutamine synthetase